MLSDKRGVENKIKKPAQRPAGREFSKWCSTLRLFRNLLTTSKRRIFQIPQDGLLYYPEKFSARFIKNCTPLKWGVCASSQDWIPIVWTFTTPCVLNANDTICLQMILNTVLGLMEYKSLVQMFNKVTLGRKLGNRFSACSEKYSDHSVLRWSFPPVSAEK